MPDPELLPPPPKKNSAGDILLPPPPKKKGEADSDNSLSGLKTPISESRSIDQVLNPANQFGVLSTPSGVKFGIDEKKLPPLINKQDYISQAQQRINNNTVLPEDVEIISTASGKKTEAVSAYLSGDDRTGNAIDITESVQKNRDALTGIINDVNKKNNWDINPDALLADPDKLSDFVQKYQKRLEQGVKENTIETMYAPMGSGVGEYVNKIGAQKAKAQKELEDFQNTYKPLLQDHVVKEKVNSDFKKGVAPEVTIQNLAIMTDPVNYKNSQIALNTPTVINPLNPLSVFQQVGALYDNVKGVEDKDESLNAVIGRAAILRNNSIQSLISEKLADYQLTGNDNSKTEATQLSQSIDKNIYKTYPSIQRSQMAAEIARDVAYDSGNLEGVQDRKSFTEHDLGTKLFGETGEGYVKRMKDKGWFDNPETQDAANFLAAHTNLFSDGSYFGTALNSLVSPVKDLGYSVMDIAGIRNNKDILSDKAKEELYPAETPGLTPTTNVLRTTTNTTFNLAGMVAIGAATGGIARAAGLGMDAAEIAEFGSAATSNARKAELASRSLSLNNKVDVLSNAASFGLPSVDANIKDAHNFLENGYAIATYASMGAILNTYGGKLLDLPKVSSVPGLSDVFAKTAKELTEKDITEKAARELLDEGKDKYVSFVTKYGKPVLDASGKYVKNVTEGAATMAYFTATNQILKSAFGDPNTTTMDVLKNTGGAFVDGLLGMMVFGAIKTGQEFNVNKNSTYKTFIPAMANAPDAYKDIINLNKKSPEDYDNKIQILNTALVAKNSLQAAMKERGIELSQEQQDVWISNKTVEAYIRKQAETAPEETKVELLSRADKLRDQSTATLDGLKFTTTLEPLYDLYAAERLYNKAVDDANNGKGSIEEIAAAKEKIDQAIDRHQNSKLSNPSEGVKYVGWDNKTGKFYVEQDGNRISEHDTRQEAEAAAFKSSAASDAAQNPLADVKDVVYHAQMVSDPTSLKKQFPPVHPNEFYHHSTIEFKPKSSDNIEVGKKGDIKITGRLTTDKVDVLLVDNPKSKNKDAHITLSTADGVKPFEANKEIENNKDKIVPIDATVSVTEGYFNGKEDVVKQKFQNPVDAVPLKEGELEQGFSRATPQLTEEQVDILQPVIDKVNNGERVNEKEINDAQDLLYTALDKNEGASHLIEPLIQKLQNYENTTKTEISTVTEKVPVEGSVANRSRQEIKPALERAEGSEARITLPDGGVRRGTLNIRGGKYVLDIKGANQIEIGEKAVTDRDLRLPSVEKVENPVELDADGNVKSVTFETPDGRLVTLENSEKALDVAIQLKLKEQEAAAKDDAINEKLKQDGIDPTAATKEERDAAGKDIKVPDGGVSDAAFDKAYEVVSKEVPVERTKKESAEVLVEPFLNKGELLGFEKPEDALRLIAEQAQNISKGEDTSILSDGTKVDNRKKLEERFGKPLVDAAIELYPKEKLIAEEQKPVDAKRVISDSEIQFRGSKDANEILKESLPEGKGNETVETNSIYDGRASVRRVKDVQRNLLKEHKLLDLLIKCLTS